MLTRSHEIKAASALGHEVLPLPIVSPQVGPTDSLYFDDDPCETDVQAHAQASHWLEALRVRLDSQQTATHARLVLAGLRSNELARRALSLCAAYPEGEKLTLAEIGVLLGAPRHRWRTLAHSLRSCGVLVPMPLWPEQEDVLRTALFKEFASIASSHEPLDAVHRLWCRTFGVTLNPEIAALLHEEIASNYA